MKTKTEIEKNSLLFHKGYEEGKKYQQEENKRLREALQKCADDLKGMAGSYAVDSFGEDPGNYYGKLACFYAEAIKALK